MSKVLVTGAQGFVGRAVVGHLLRAGFDVHGVSRGAMPADGLPITWHQADLHCLEEVKALCAKVEAQHLLHLAWCAKPGSYWTSPDNLRWVQATLGLLESFRLQGGESAVLAGSCAEYDWRYGYLQEALTPLQPSTIYGRSKNACRELAAVFAELHGMPVAWGRIFFAYGPHEAPARMIPAVACALLQGREALCSHGRQLRDFIHVEDVASALLKLLEAKASGAFNIGSGRPVSIAEVAEQLAIASGRNELLRLGALPAGVDEPPLLVADVRKLQALGWKPQIDLSNGLENTLAWWQKQDGQAQAITEK